MRALVFLAVFLPVWAFGAPIGQPSGGSAASFTASATSGNAFRQKINTAHCFNSTACTAFILHDDTSMFFELPTGDSFVWQVNNVTALTLTASQLTVAANIDTGAYQIFSKYMGPGSSSTILTLEGRNNNANQVGIRLAQISTMTAATNRYAVSVAKGHDTDDLLLIDTYGKFHRPAVVVNTAVLVSGTVTVSSSVVRTGDIIRVTLSTPGGTCGLGGYSAPIASITDATSFVINNVDATGSTVATCTSTVAWEIITPNVTL